MNEIPGPEIEEGVVPAFEEREFTLVLRVHVGVESGMMGVADGEVLAYVRVHRVHPHYRGVESFAQRVEDRPDVGLDYYQVEFGVWILVDFFELFVFEYLFGELVIGLVHDFCLCVGPSVDRHGSQEVILLAQNFQVAHVYFSQVFKGGILQR